MKRPFVVKFLYEFEGLKLVSDVTVMCSGCFLLLLAYLAVGAAGTVLLVLFPSCGISCCQCCRACVAFLFPSSCDMSCRRGYRACCLFCFLLPVACLAVGAIGRVLHVLFLPSCSMSCCLGCRDCVACWFYLKLIQRPSFETAPYMWICQPVPIDS
jgi:hypothetical protein